jgi:hypothetical protein
MSEPPSVVGRRSRGAASAPHSIDDGVPTPSNAASPTSADLLKLVRGYPPVLGAMLLVDGVITLILGGDSTVTLGEVVAYLLLPPLAMFLVTQTTGGRRLNAVSLGVSIAGAAVLLAALFLLGGVHLVTMPPWVLILAGAALLGVALFVMRLSAPAAPERDVSPLLSPSERATFDPDADDFGARDDFGSAQPSAGARDEYGIPAPRDEFGSASGAYDRPAEPGWPPSHRDDPAGDDTVHGLPRVPSHSAGPPEPEWPPRREPIGAPWSAESRPEPAATWSDDDSGSAESRWSAQPSWSTGSGRSAEPGRAAEPSWSAEAAEPGWTNGSGRPAEPSWSAEADRPAEPSWSAQPDRSAGPADREWPPSPAAAEWPPRRDPEQPPAAAPAPEQRSWFEPDGPADREWHPSERTYQSGRRSRPDG